jgi:hypothetical protein
MTDTTDDRPSIAELKLLERALVDPPWAATHGGWIMAPNKLSPVGGTRSPARANGATESDADQQARRIAGIRNATPVLLEIAVAALALRGQGCTDPGCMEQHSSRCSVSVAETVLDAALAKVRP